MLASIKIAPPGKPIPIVGTAKTSAAGLIKPGRLTTASAASSPTMIKLKSKTAKPVETPVSMADRIRETCAAAEQYIESRVDALKASPEGQQLPRDWLMLNTRA